MLRVAVTVPFQVLSHHDCLAKLVNRGVDHGDDPCTVLDQDIAPDLHEIKAQAGGDVDGVVLVRIEVFDGIFSWRNDELVSPLSSSQAVIPCPAVKEVIAGAANEQILSCISHELI